MDKRRRICFFALAFCYLASSANGFSTAAAAATRPSRRSNNSKLGVSQTFNGRNSLNILTSGFGGGSSAYQNDESHLRGGASGSATNPNRMTRWTRKTKEAVSRLFPPTKEDKEEEEYERRKKEWAERYTNVDSLRQLFGDNKNKLWGDLDATTTRRLYKTLLPKALLEMLSIGVTPEDLAPLAYSARVAAKLYARERCVVPARMLAIGYDGVRQLKKYGKFQPAGMTYPQVWQKYEAAILEELDGDELRSDDDVTAKICLKILEKSCATNEGIDRLVLPRGYANAQAIQEQDLDLTTIIAQLERDVHDLLSDSTTTKKTDNYDANRIKTLRLLVRAKRRLDKLHHHRSKEEEEESTSLHHHHQEEPPQEHHHQLHHESKIWNNRLARHRQRDAKHQDS